MGTYAWLHPERHDLYLAARVFAGAGFDGDWIQWAGNIVLIHIELYDDPLQGRDFWLFDDELIPANACAEALWAVVESDPYSVPELLAASPSAATVRETAATLVATIERNGRGIPDSLSNSLAEAAATRRSENSVRAWWSNVVPLLAKRE
ncbi:hypothetical protein [Sphingomonas sp. BK580]|uniref:hypothetical protein n=1 Tax=Sphingomonas sp. BK580 TaxID=2586972 RepID=UPI00160EAB30|nr:hypothetical protein [Sphingomonas sp. BK580]MBB3694780.1 hypothetical protein [Sphingomonas sp. BK580]